MWLGVSWRFFKWFAGSICDVNAFAPKDYVAARNARVSQCRFCAVASGLAATGQRCVIVLLRSWLNVGGTLRRGEIISGGGRTERDGTERNEPSFDSHSTVPLSVCVRCVRCVPDANACCCLAEELGMKGTRRAKKTEGRFMW